MEHINGMLAQAEQNIILKGADKITRYGFTQVPNYVLESEELTPGAKLVYAMLLKYAWNNDRCFPGQERLANDMRVSRASANTYIKELEKNGFLTIHRRGQGKTNLYTLDVTVDGKTVDKS